MKTKVLSIEDIKEKLALLLHIPMVEEIAVLVYENYRPVSYTGENVDMSIWWGYIHERNNYTSELMEALYWLHEFSHMTINGLNLTNPEDFAQSFDDSERFASYMTEVWVHLHDPTLENELDFPQPMLWKWFRMEGYQNKTFTEGVDTRSAIVEAQIALPSEFKHEEERMHPYAGNKEWAMKLRDKTPLWLKNPLGSEPKEYRLTIESNLNQKQKVMEKVQ